LIGRYVDTCAQSEGKCVISIFISCMEQREREGPRYWIPRYGLDQCQSATTEKMWQTRTIPPKRNATTCPRRLDAFGNAQSEEIKY
jgi:hypothetical protein